MSIAARAAALFTTLLLTALLLNACVSAREPEIPAGGRAEPPLTVGVLVLEGAFAAEVTAAFEVCGRTRDHTEPGLAVVAIGRTTDPVRTREGLRLAPDHALGDAPSLDVLVVAGGIHTTDQDLEDLDLIGWISKRGQAAKRVVGLGRGAWLLAESGLLRDRACALTPEDAEAFRKQYPYLRVVTDRSLLADHETLTSAGGGRSHEAALQLVQALCGAEAAAAVARDLGLPAPDTAPKAPREPR